MSYELDAMPSDVRLDLRSLSITDQEVALDVIDDLAETAESRGHVGQENVTRVVPLPDSDLLLRLRFVVDHERQ
ncbi:MAG: hypothetical protein AAF743_05125, partial [Planctomycetota bacterium]